MPLKAIVVFATSVVPPLVRALDPAATYGAVEPYWLSREKQAHIANCVVDVGIASTFLGKAGIAIHAAVKNCDKKGNTTAACTAAVSGIVASFGYVAAFISASAAECRSSLRIVDEHAVLAEGCAASISIIVTTLSLMVNSGATIKDTCPGERQHDAVTRTDAEALDSGARRLQAPVANAAEQRRLAASGGNKTLVYEKLEEAARKLEMSGFQIPKHRSRKSKRKSKRKQEPAGRTAAQNAACAFDVSQFTFVSARAGLMINYAVMDCSSQALLNGDDLSRAKCIMHLGRTIAAFGYTASGIVFAVFECPDIIDNLDAACAGAIINLVSGTADLLGNGAGVFATCHQLGQGEAADEA